MPLSGPGLALPPPPWLPTPCVQLETRHRAAERRLQQLQASRVHAVDAMQDEVHRLNAELAQSHALLTSRSLYLALPPPATP